MKRTIVDKLPNCKKRYSASKDIIVCENGEIYVPWKYRYHKLSQHKSGGHKNVVYVYHDRIAYNAAKEVWQAFKGEIVKMSEHIIPKDGNEFNTAIDNLEKISRSEWFRRHNSYPRKCKVRNKLTGEIYPTVLTVSKIEGISNCTMFNTLRSKREKEFYPELREKYEIIE